MLRLLAHRVGHPFIRAPVVVVVEVQVVILLLVADREGGVEIERVVVVSMMMMFIVELVRVLAVHLMAHITLALRHLPRPPVEREHGVGSFSRLSPTSALLVVVLLVWRDAQPPRPVHLAAINSEFRMPRARTAFSHVPLGH